MVNIHKVSVDAAEEYGLGYDLIAGANIAGFKKVANMPTTAEGIEVIKASGAIIGPAKAVNAGGVAVSALEMAQNSMRYSWTEEEVDAKLKQIMFNIHKVSVEAAEEYGLGYDLIAGANIAGFKKVANAKMAQGIIK